VLEFCNRSGAPTAEHLGHRPRIARPPIAKRQPCAPPSQLPPRRTLLGPELTTGAVTAEVEYFNQTRPHQPLDQDFPCKQHGTIEFDRTKIRRERLVDGLIVDYSIAALIFGQNGTHRVTNRCSVEYNSISMAASLRFIDARNGWHNRLKP
jgi:hypothetical protein